MKITVDAILNIIDHPPEASAKPPPSIKKKQKRHFSISAVDSSLPQKDFWKFRNHNPKDPYVGDFSEFAFGRVEAGNQFAALKWMGEIKPRQTLARELIPTIQEHFLGKSSGTGRQLTASFRSFWRFLDGCIDALQVTSLADLTDLHGAMMCASGFQTSQMTTVRKIINLARERTNLAPLYWTIPEKGDTTSSVPETEHVKAIHHYLIRQVFDNTFKRWEDADRLAMSGTDWSTMMSMRATLSWSEADRHATYRGLAVLIGDPCPMPRDTGGVSSQTGMGIRWDTPATQPLPPLLEGLFPKRDDVVNLIHLFMIRTGWNGSTVLNIDANDYIRPHPTSPEHHVVHAIKVRPSGAEQFAIGQNKSERSPGNLLKRQIERTEPLRVLLRRQLAELKSASETQPYSDSRALEMARVENMIGSPWIFFSIFDTAKIGMVDGQSFHRKEGQSALPNVIRQINSKRDSASQIPVLKASDFRDAFIGFAHARSGNIWFVAMLAGQHRSPRSTTPYLSHLQNKTQAWATISKVSNALWKEVKERRVADPAILRFLVANGEISEEQRLRWQEHKSLTRVGMGCRDIKSPPIWLASDHQAGETCRVQRCTLCPNGLLVEGSVDFLSRRKAELLHAQLSMGMAAWDESTFPAELQGLEWNLEEYDMKIWQERVRFWQEEINEGRHRVPTFVGSYA